MNVNDIVNKLLDSAEKGAEINMINITLPSRDSGNAHRNRSRAKRRQSEKKARRRNRKK